MQMTFNFVDGIFDFVVSFDIKNLLLRKFVEKQKKLSVSGIWIKEFLKNKRVYFEATLNKNSTKVQHTVQTLSISLQEQGHIKAQVQATSLFYAYSPDCTPPDRFILSRSCMRLKGELARRLIV